MKSQGFINHRLQVWVQSMKTFLLCYTKGYPRVVTLAERSLSMCLTSCWSAWPLPAPCLARLSWRLEYPEPELVTVSITCSNTC